MSAHGAHGAGEILHLFEVDALGQLHDRAVREIGQDASILMTLAINAESGPLPKQTEQGPRKRLRDAVLRADLPARGWREHAPARWRKE